MRAAAALTVVASHLAYPRFTRGDYIIVRELNLGSDAVVLFFVISGFVIAYAADRDATPGRFAFRRATRLFSVAAPALVLTLVLDRAGALVNPAAYDGWWWNPAPAWEVLLRGLSFSTEWGLGGFRPGSNGPYWSLSYEAGYYLLFGAAFFTRRAARVGLLAVGAFVIGPKVLVLAPAWLMGVAVHRAIRIPPERSLASCWLLALAPAAMYGLLLSAGAPVLLLGLTKSALGPEVVAWLRFSDEFLWNALVGALVSIHLLGVSGLFRMGRQPGVAARAVRWIAGASFSIYLVHYPVLQFVDAVLPKLSSGVIRDVLLLGTTLGVCLLFAEAFERTLPAFRQTLVRAGEALRPSRPAVQQEGGRKILGPWRSR